MTRTSHTRGSPPAVGAARIKGDYRRYDPFRKPAWRWLRAEELFAQGRKPRRWEDPAVTLALRYIRGRAGRSSRARGRSGAGDQVPDLTAAHAIYTGGGALRDEVEARLLTGQPLSDVSARTGVIPSVLQAYETFFSRAAKPA